MRHIASKRQRGLSLVELMVALTIGIFISAGMVGLFVNSKQSYRLNENMSRLQENARFAVSFIARDIRMADYRSCANNDRLVNSVSGEDKVIGEDGPDIDTLTLLWQTNACMTALATEARVYSIQEGANGILALFRSVNGVDRELVEGVESLQILYGEDTDNDDAPDKYVDASSITDMAQAVSIRVTLVVRTLESNLTTTGQRITREFGTTVTLRNRLP